MSFYLNKNRGLELIINEFLENKRKVLENERGLFIHLFNREKGVFYN